MIWPFNHLSPTTRAIRKARKIIERKGWTQGSARGVYVPGGECAASALIRGARHLGLHDDAVLETFADRVGLPSVAKYGDMSPTQRVVTWNDTLGLDETTVIEVLRKAERVE